MLKLRTTHNGKPLVMLGLSDENMARLKDRQPIRINLSEVGMGAGALVIFNECDEEALAERLERVGILAPGMGTAAAQAAKEPKSSH